jgi:hypothetical protein
MKENNMSNYLSRRNFLGAAAGMAALAARTALTQGNVNAAALDPAAYKYWMHGFGGTDPKVMAQAFKQAGFNTIVAGGDPVIAAIREANMEAWLCGGAFGVGADETAMQAVDINGEHRIWFGSGCPNNPTIRERSLKSYRDMAATKNIQGILVDGCRFASPASGLNAYFTCFCDTCAGKAAKLGFDFAKMKQDAKALFDLLAAKGASSKREQVWLQEPAGLAEFMTQYPGVLEWLRFRRTCVTEHFRALSEIIHGAGLRMGVYIFTPSLAPLVGQSYVDLAEFMDVFAPMIYRNYPDKPGEACLNWELTNIPEELGFSGQPNEAAVMELVLSWLGMKDIVPQRTIKDVRAALTPEAVGHETRMARALIGNKELAPIIYIDDPMMAKTAEQVRANGANGVNFFVYKDAWAEMVRPAIQK